MKDLVNVLAWGIIGIVTVLIIYIIAITYLLVTKGI